MSGASTQEKEETDVCRSMCALICLTFAFAMIITPIVFSEIDYRLSDAPSFDAYRQQRDIKRHEFKLEQEARRIVHDEMLVRQKAALVREQAIYEARVKEIMEALKIQEIHDNVPRSDNKNEL